MVLEDTNAVVAKVDNVYAAIGGHAQVRWTVEKSHRRIDPWRRCGEERGRASASSHRERHWQLLWHLESVRLVRSSERRYAAHVISTEDLHAIVPRVTHENVSFCIRLDSLWSTEESIGFTLTAVALHVRRRTTGAENSESMIVEVSDE